MSVRAKFFVNRMTVYNSGSPPSVILMPVYAGADASDEDKAFWSATPSGEMTLNISNPAAAEFFQLGKRYYVTFEEVPDGS